MKPNYQWTINILSTPKETIELHEFMGKLDEKLTQARSEAKETLQQSQVDSKERYDRNTAAPTFQVGDKVRVFTPKPKMGLTKKLLHFWHGPYEILQKISSVNYKIVHHRRGNPFLVHSNHLKLCHTAQRTLDERNVENDQINDQCTENGGETKTYLKHLMIPLNPPQTQVLLMLYFTQSSIK